MAKKFTDEFAAIHAVLDDPALTPRGLVRQVLAEIAQQEFPPGVEPQVKAALSRFCETVTNVLRSQPDFHVLAREAGELRRAVRDLGRPLPTPTPHEVVARIFDHLQELGWASATIQLLETELQPGETFTAASPDSVTTSNERVIDRRELIVKYRPRSMTPDHFPAWEKMHTRSPSMASPPPRE